MGSYNAKVSKLLDRLIRLNVNLHVLDNFNLHLVRCSLVLGNIKNSRMKRNLKRIRCFVSRYVTIEEILSIFANCLSYTFLCVIKRF